MALRKAQDEASAHLLKAEQSTAKQQASELKEAEAKKKFKHLKKKFNHYKAKARNYLWNFPLRLGFKTAHGLEVSFGALRHFGTWLLVLHLIST